MERPTSTELELLHANICSALSDPKRLLILYTLAEGPRNVTALADELGMPQPTVSRHLNTLRQKHLVAAERDGAAVIYRLAELRIIEVLEMMRDILRAAIAEQNGLLTSSSASSAAVSTL